MSENRLICIPKSDTTKRFLLGQQGKKELLAIPITYSKAIKVTEFKKFLLNSLEEYKKRNP